MDIRINTWNMHTQQLSCFFFLLIFFYYFIFWPVFVVSICSWWRQLLSKLKLLRMVSILSSLLQVHYPSSVSLGQNCQSFRTAAWAISSGNDPAGIMPRGDPARVAWARGGGWVGGRVGHIKVLSTTQGHLRTESKIETILLADGEASNSTSSLDSTC